MTASATTVRDSMAQSKTRKGSTTVSGDIPRFVTYTSPVPTTPIENGSRATTLPLNIIALIVNYLDDLGDIARVTRTCRLLYYMTLPQLYTKVALHSYATIRYINGRPEGFGSGSPFQMALNGLVTKTHASVVQEFRVHGEWNEAGAEDFAKGRVPDNTMMLNILLRAATDKMTKLQVFSWELDCKPLKTLYQGLSTHSTLTSLTVRFPRTRIPRPSVIVPPMSNLRVFKAMDIDPLCYPDDISVLLLSSKKLEDVRLHFSPRMRQEAESSLSWSNYFGRAARAGYKMPLKHFAIQNFYGPNVEGFADVLDHDTCRSIAFLDMFGGVKGASANVFMDDTWRQVPDDVKTKFQNVRINEPASQHIAIMSTAVAKTERLYFVSAKAANHTTDQKGKLPATPDEPCTDTQAADLGKNYIHAITRYHGSSLKHLLLWDLWNISREDLRELIRFCPNLEQLGFGVNSDESLEVMHLLIPFLPKLQALRLLLTDTVETACTSNDHWEEMETTFGKAAPLSLKWIGIGKRTFRLGDHYEDINDEGRMVSKVRFTEVTLEDVQHVEIWRLDCLDIMVDPITPFFPSVG